jgi:hypothetical protein
LYDLFLEGTWFGFYDVNWMNSYHSFCVPHLLETITQLFAKGNFDFFSHELLESAEGIKLFLDLYGGWSVRLFCRFLLSFVVQRSYFWLLLFFYDVCFSVIYSISLESISFFSSYPLVFD